MDSRLIDECRCGRALPVEEKDAPWVCPNCGRPLDLSNSNKARSDSLVDAAFEILAENGAIFSGAR